MNPLYPHKQWSRSDDPQAVGAWLRPVHDDCQRLSALLARVRPDTTLTERATYMRSRASPAAARRIIRSLVASHWPSGLVTTRRARPGGPSSVAHSLTAEDIGLALGRGELVILEADQTVDQCERETAATVWMVEVTVRPLTHYSGKPSLGHSPDVLDAHKVNS